MQMQPAQYNELVAFQAFATFQQQTMLAQLQQEAHALRSRGQQLATENDALKAEDKRLRALADERTESIIDSGHQIDRLNAEISEMRGVVVECNTTIRDLNAEVARLTKSTPKRG